MTAPIFTKEALDAGEPPGLEFAHYRKTTTVRAARIDGPFEVQTIHDGLVTCRDGWLAIDSHGYPYPIAAEEFARIYEPAEKTVTTAQ